jgi:hypothetical protein
VDLPWQNGKWSNEIELRYQICKNYKSVLWNYGMGNVWQSFCCSAAFCSCRNLSRFEIAKKFRYWKWSEHGVFSCLTRFSVLGILKRATALFERTDLMFLRAFAKWMATYSRVMYVRPSVCPHEQRGHRQTDFRGIPYFGFVVKFVDALRFWLKSDEDNALYIKNYTLLCDWSLKWEQTVFWMRYELRPKTQ